MREAQLDWRAGEPPETVPRLEEMKALFPEFKPLPEGVPKNQGPKNNGIPIGELVTELQKMCNDLFLVIHQK